MPLNRKLFVSDLDGTLLKSATSYSKEITQSNKEAILDYTKDGNIFAVATARGFGYYAKLKQLLGFDFAYVGDNGASIYINKDNSIDHFIDPAIYHTMCAFFENSPYYGEIALCIGNDWY